MMSYRKLEHKRRKREEQLRSMIMILGGGILTFLLCCSSYQNQSPAVIVNAFKPNTMVINPFRFKREHTVNLVENISSQRKKFIDIRGGEINEVEIESDSEEYSDDEDMDDNDEKEGGEITDITEKVLSLFSDAVMTIVKILGSILNSTTKKSGSLSSSSSSDIIGSSFKDFGEYLSTAYDCIDDYEDEDDESRVCIEGGSLSNALTKARSKARLLVIFIPGSKPPAKNKSYDKLAIQSILSADVNVAAEHKVRKKEKYGSFLFWATKVDSNEAMKTMKRLKIKPSSSSKKKCPTLVVVYPAQTMDGTGKFKIVPRVIGQHHCNPPPSPESMSAWLNSLRKRHSKQYAAMHKELREIAFMKERTEGYETSVQQDRKRVEDERKEEERRIEEERIQKEKEEQLKKRRKELLESLPEEPQGTEGVINIALRFGDGRTGQRKFTDDTHIDTLFDWVDAIFEEEREAIILTTMNGQQSFSFGEDDKTLNEAGLGRLVAFRVSVKEGSNDGETGVMEDDEVE